MAQGKIVVLGTGGTIAGTARSASDHVGYSAAQLGVQALLDAVPALGQARPIEAEQVAQIDSKDLDFTVWQRLALRCAQGLAREDVQGIVITHGTDTLEESAYFLQRMLSPAKPVVLTCAMRPATALMADGPQNLLDAVAVARTPGAHGVVAVCAGVVHAAIDVAKQHTYRLDAFTSGDAGPIARVEEGRIVLMRNWPQASMDARSSAIEKVANIDRWPRVEIVLNYAGAGGAVVRALLDQGVDGIVAAGTGNGTLHHDLEAALLEAQAQGVRVLRTSRCAEGRVIGHEGDRLPHAGGLSPVKARIALMLDLLGVTN